MRMWNIDPKLMCKKHLLGEHVEMHMFVGAIKKGKNIKGYIEKGLVEIDKIKQRHDELVDEMISRGIKHKSYLEQVEGAGGKVDSAANLIEICRRCKECRKRIEDK